jgi:hypothetical protein
MGNQVSAPIRYDGALYDSVKVLLETDEVIVRGDLKLRVGFATIKEAKTDGDDLILKWDGHELRVPAAAKWAQKILNPKSRLDKLGVKRDQKVCAVGRLDADFLAELEASGADVSRKLRKNADVIFTAIDDRGELDSLLRTRQFLQGAGALWVVRPKGSPAITEAEVMQAGKASGLVDVKVIRFSATHTAEKFVVPLTQR